MRLFLEALQGSDFIVHAGHIRRPAILKRLDAPRPANRGNTDSHAWGFSHSRNRGARLRGPIHVIMYRQLHLDPAAVVHVVAFAIRMVLGYVRQGVLLRQSW